MLRDWPSELSQTSVHIWRLRIGAWEDVEQRLGKVLSVDEADRALRLRSVTQRRLFVATRGALRSLLGRYLDIDPAQIQFSYGLSGKPWLPSTAGIQFNVSHSAGMAVVAITRGCPAGVDLEYMDLMTDLLDVASRFFCLEETEELKSLAPRELNRAFFRCWTRKEAFAKATGEGLRVPLDHFRVTVRPGLPPRLVHIRHNRLDAKEWLLRDLFCQ
jgi:4'-phosphopantetheinyl transferase